MEEREHAYFILMEWALRLAVEYIIVDLKFSSERVSHLVRSSGRTRVIGHYLSRDENPWGWDEDARMIEYNRAKSLGCDMVRFVRATSKASDNNFVRAFVNKIESIPDHLPIVAYNLGEHGRPSLVANKIFTPVTHPIMNTTVSKSQIRQFLPTASEAMQALYQTKILDPLHFYHLGASVFYSLSPAMHTAAYQVCGMNNDFQSLQVSSLEDIHRIIQDSNFGGAAITQPFKVQILSRIAAKSYHAKAIGAVNTLLPLRLFQNSSPLDGSTESLLRQANQRCKAGPIAVCVLLIVAASSPSPFIMSHRFRDNPLGVPRIHAHPDRPSSNIPRLPVHLDTLHSNVPPVAEYLNADTHLLGVLRRQYRFHRDHDLHQTKHVTKERHPTFKDYWTCDWSRWYGSCRSIRHDPTRLSKGLHLQPHY
jgi:hypothetical protein